jgi:hypothetical protein
METSLAMMKLQNQSQTPLNLPALLPITYVTPVAADVAVPLVVDVADVAETN